jgi:hypothetical protein
MAGPCGRYPPIVTATRAWPLACKEHGSEMRRAHKHFDVDDTLITWNLRFRPHVREEFAALRAEGHQLYV